jgi:CHAD domain-containing protein
MSNRPQALLPLNVSAAVSAVAYQNLEAAGSALAELRKGGSSESLHDFRLAVRRLRSLLETYRPWLGRAAGKKMQRGLRELGRATNRGRDAHVQLSWIEAQLEALPRRARRGTGRLVRRLKADRKKGYKRSRGRVRESYGRTASKLVKRLKRLETTGPSLAEVLPPLIRLQTGELEVRLAAIRGAEDVEGAHDARIAGKRLRYLLEPIANESGEARLILERLKTLHGDLGEINDLHLVLRTLDDEVDQLADSEARHLKALPDRPVENGDRASAGGPQVLLGLEGLAARARAQRDELFAELENRWLRGRGSDFFIDADRFAGTLGRVTRVPPNDHASVLQLDARRAAPTRAPARRAVRKTAAQQKRS